MALARCDCCGGKFHHMEIWSVITQAGEFRVCGECEDALEDKVIHEGNPKAVDVTLIQRDIWKSFTGDRYA